MANPITTNTTNTDKEGEGPSSNYLAFALVLAFFFVGLTGVVVCHVLKKRGYRFTTSQGDDDDYDDVFEDGDEEMERRDRHETMSENDDTVGHIIQCIMKNEANSDALNAMVPNITIDLDPAGSPPLTPVSPVSPPGAGKLPFSQLHTIGGVNAGENKLPLMKRPSQRKSIRRRPSQVTVLSVGRFRVTKCDKSGKERTTLDSEGSFHSASADVPSNSKVMTHSPKEKTED